MNSRQAERYSLGLDFGTESCRALLVNVHTGEELAQDVFAYPSGVITEGLPATDVFLERDWALQDPGDYLEALSHVVVGVLRQAGIRADEVIGIGVDFTACTLIPTTADGTPLSRLEVFRERPHAWTKLWKHHAAQGQADRINTLATKEGQSFLKYYGGRVSSEWAFPKALQVLEEDPEVFQAADRFIEAGDWVVWQLTGCEVRNACAAGYKGLWNAESGYPDPGFLAKLTPGFEHSLEKLAGRVVPPGTRVGGLTESWAKELGLAAGTSVAAAGIDAHVGVLGSSVACPDEMVMIMGTSTCHVVMTEDAHFFLGFAGLVRDGIVDGLFGYEYGQSAVGDIFAWFVNNAVPAVYEREAGEMSTDLHTLLSRKASKLKPGANGLLALDWQGGNRSPLMNANLSGLLLGLTVRTKPEEIYRALIEATAFGTRKIIETHEAGANPIKRLSACGGLTKNTLVMQIYADVLGRTIRVPASQQPVALGSAMLGALAAGLERGGHGSLKDAVVAMTGRAAATFEPNAGSNGAGAHSCYDQLYGLYLRLFTQFGVTSQDLMVALKEFQ
jgi:L-ribulokinase